VTIASPPMLLLPGGSDLYTEEPRREPEPAPDPPMTDLASGETIVRAKDLVSEADSGEPIVPDVAPLYSDPHMVSSGKAVVSSKVSSPVRWSTQEDPVPQEEPVTQRNKAPQAERPANVYKETHFDLVELKAGSGGSKIVYYIDEPRGDWVLALPNEPGKFDGYWPNMVREELHLSDQLQELGIPCLEMHGVMSTNLDEAKGVAVPALRMRSFDYYRRTNNTVIMEAKPNGNSFAPDEMDRVIRDAVYRSARRISAKRAVAGETAWVESAADALVALLTPLARDIKKLAERCIGLGVDSLSWQVVFEDTTLLVPLEIRVFLFDLTSKWTERKSILASEREPAAEKARKAREYVDNYFGAIYPFVGEAKYRTPKYRALKNDVLARMRVVALSSAA
jgi:hypothetical protein